MSKSIGIDLGTSFICAGVSDTNATGIRGIGVLISSGQEKVIIQKMIDLLNEWYRNDKFYKGNKYHYESMMSACHDKCDNIISWDEFFSRIKTLIEESNNEFHKMHYHHRNQISDNDYNQFYSLYDNDHSTEPKISKTH